MESVTFPFFNIPMAMASILEVGLTQIITTQLIIGINLNEGRLLLTSSSYKILVNSEGEEGEEREGDAASLLKSLIRGRKERRCGSLRWLLNRRWKK